MIKLCGFISIFEKDVLQSITIYALYWKHEITVLVVNIIIIECVYALHNYICSYVTEKLSHVCHKLSSKNENNCFFVERLILYITEGMDRNIVVIKYSAVPSRFEYVKSLPCKIVKGNIASAVVQNSRQKFFLGWFHETGINQWPIWPIKHEFLWSNCEKTHYLKTRSYNYGFNQ